MTKRLTQWRAKLSGKESKTSLNAYDFRFCAIGERLGLPRNTPHIISIYLTEEAARLAMDFPTGDKKERLAIIRKIEALPRILKAGSPTDLVDTFLVKTK